MKSKRMYGVLVVMMFVSFLSISWEGDVLLAAEQPVKLKVLSSWTPEYLFVREWLIPYIQRLNQNSKGRLEVSRVGPEAIPPFEQLKPVSTGLFDMLFTHASYHSGEIAIGNGMDLVKGTPKERREAGLVEFIEKAYQNKKLNVKYLSVSCGEFGFHYMVKKELKKADFTGLKIRTTNFHDPLAKALGAATVTIAPAEIYSSLEKGVVDAMVWPVVGALDYKWYEVVKFQLRPKFGYLTEQLLMNLDSWNKLPKDLQNYITKETSEWEALAYKILTAKAQEEEDKLVKLGMKLNVLPPAEAEKFLNTFYKKTWEDLVFKLEPDLGPKLKQLADKLERKSK